MGNTPKFLASIVAGVLIAFVAYQIGFQTACSKNNTLKESPDSNESLGRKMFCKQSFNPQLAC